MSTPQIHQWKPLCPPYAVWHRLQQYEWCCIFDVGDWRIAAVSTQPKWKTTQQDWFNLPDIQVSQNLVDPSTPPFISGTLSIVSFDGTIHAWRPELTVAFHTIREDWVLWGTPEQFTNLTTSNFHHPSSNNDARLPSITTIQSNMDVEEYQDAVQQTRMEIEEGNVYQINLSHQLGPIHIQNPLQIWLTLMADNPATHGCYWQTPSEVLICNSPEQFLLFKGDGTLQSTPIKGTHNTPNAPNAYEELLHSDKEKSELTMIVDMMRNDISQVCKIGSVIAHPRTIRQCGDLLHAEQTVQGTLESDITRWKAVHACFPPASVTGAPKIAAIDLISRLETINRGWYTGSFGWMDQRGSSVWNVLIRTIQCEPLNPDGSTTGVYNVGAGIVYDSDPAKEWLETLAKSRAINEVLQTQIDT